MGPKVHSRVLAKMNVLLIFIFKERTLIAGPSRVDVCPLPAIHKRRDPILDPMSRLPVKLNNTRCKAHLTKQLSHNGTRTVRLIRGLHSPLNPPAIKKISNGFD